MISVRISVCLLSDIWRIFILLSQKSLLQQFIRCIDCVLVITIHATNHWRGRSRRQLMFILISVSAASATLIRLRLRDQLNGWCSASRIRFTMLLLITAIIVHHKSLLFVINILIIRIMLLIIISQCHLLLLLLSLQRRRSIHIIHAVRKEHDHNRHKRNHGQRSSNVVRLIEQQHTAALLQRPVVISDKSAITKVVDHSVNGRE
mmetsp:Transcript_631/g.940  ORF Transcript_631/g.940 Transcript_631/m.940 type:complete len:205 (+) Transcript_631:1-615(+)